MRIVIPMAGMGKRLRPHTLTIPKPLIPIAGKTMIQRLVEDIVKVCNTSIEEIAFVIGDFGKETEDKLVSIAETLGAKGKIYYQNEPLGTAHAILCAEETLTGPIVVAFADTLFKADFSMDLDQDGIIWVKQVEDPKAFGVVKIGEDGYITDFVEKPEEFVSDLAIIGIYYTRDGENLKSELQYLLDNDIKDKGEYQLTNALENMKNNGIKFTPVQINEWLDCGNKANTIYTHQRILELKQDEELVSSSSEMKNSVIIPPCFIGDNTVIENSVIGPHVSIEANSKVNNSVIKNSIIQANSTIYNGNFSNSMVGNYAEYSGETKELSIGDYCTNGPLKE
ncbi:MAG: nucleotidyltransferase [Bacteroidia bacterium]|nr:nucleotidyltransferase [Bacteroidia bacterium]MBN4052245.1 hypothetical protein [Sphingobacteriaceae bacterium AH-315-L07]